MKKFTVTLTNDLFAHLEALKLYYGYTTRTEIIEKALDGLISKHASNDIFRYYLSGVKKRIKDEEVKK
nr:MAG TPA: mRNA interferase EndoA [Caudoviricetes sp.]